MSTLLELVTRVRKEIIEPIVGTVDDPEIKDWLNESNRDLVIEWGIEAGPTTIVTAVDTEFYNTPADFGRAVLLERETQGGSAMYRPLAPLTSRLRDEVSGTPRGYYTFAGQIGIVPVPDKVVNLRLWYYKSPVTLVADGDISPLPENFHRLLFLYAVSQAKRKTDDTAYETYINDYAAGRANMIDIRERQRLGSQAFGVVKDVG